PTLVSPEAIASMLDMSRRHRSLRLCLLAMGALFVATDGAVAKERHLEQLRVALVARAARCASCHISNDRDAWEGAGLNHYGQRLHDISPGDTLADRIAELDHGPKSSDSGDAAATRKNDQDIDGDGIPNWIEILAGASPADPKSVPAQKRVERVRRVISCAICHTETHLPGKQGLEANPHNEFGELLSVTTGEKNKANEDAQSNRRRTAERLPILKRVEISRKKKPRGGKATYWEKLRLMRSPADAEDNPSKENLASFRKRAARQRSKKKRDPTRGMVDAAHDNDGFLQDGKLLE
ncbi:MAG: hypothetical protein KDA33_07770, partial [Phycisphaerales bacterium]|nr:hypothetical protein [Phycisphaerales bacterium]